MRQFHVPQFIDVEDKIFGPLTLKQFLYIIGGAGLTFIIYALLRSYLPLFLIITLAIPVVTFFLALAFYQVNGRPFMKVLENALSHYSNARLYIWKKVDRQVEVTETKENISYQDNMAMPKKSKMGPGHVSKLRDLAWSIDIQDHARTNIKK